MLLDKVKKYRGKEYDLNCAETMIYAANEEYKLELSKKTFKTMAAFGGGMGIESTCGAITGSLATLGILFTQDRAHESDKIKELSQEFFKKFEDRLGSKSCKYLKEKYRTEDTGCNSIMYVAAEILDEIVRKEKYE